MCVCVCVCLFCLGEAVCQRVPALPSLNITLVRQTASLWPPEGLTSDQGTAERARSLFPAYTSLPSLGADTNFQHNTATMSVPCGDTQADPPRHIKARHAQTQGSFREREPWSARFCEPCFVESEHTRARHDQPPFRQRSAAKHRGRHHPWTPETTKLEVFKRSYCRRVPAPQSQPP